MVYVAAVVVFITLLILVVLLISVHHYRKYKRRLGLDPLAPGQPFDTVDDIGSLTIEKGLLLSIRYNVCFYFDYNNCTISGII